MLQWFRTRLPPPLPSLPLPSGFSHTCALHTPNATVYDMYGCVFLSVLSTGLLTAPSLLIFLLPASPHSLNVSIYCSCQSIRLFSNAAPIVRPVWSPRGEGRIFAGRENNAHCAKTEKSSIRKLLLEGFHGWEKVGWKSWVVYSGLMFYKRLYKLY